jgi:transposase
MISISEIDRRVAQNWSRIEPLIGRRSTKGRPAADARRVLTAGLYIITNRLTWNCVPQEYPRARTCQNWFLKWQADGRFIRAAAAAGLEAPVAEALLERGAVVRK